MAVTRLVAPGVVPQCKRRPWPVRAKTLPQRNCPPCHGVGGAADGADFGSRERMMDAIARARRDRRNNFHISRSRDSTRILTQTWRRPDFQRVLGQFGFHGFFCDFSCHAMCLSLDYGIYAIHGCMGEQRVSVPSINYPKIQFITFLCVWLNARATRKKKTTQRLFPAVGFLSNSLNEKRRRVVLNSDDDLPRRLVDYI